MRTTSHILVERARQGDPAALDKLLNLCGPYARRRLRQHGLVNRADQDDLVQEVLIRVLGGLPGFSQRGKGSFRAWVKAICRNALLSFRGRPAHREVVIGEMVEALGCLSAGVSGHDRRMDAAAMVRVLWEWQREQLNGPHRRAFELLEFEGLSAVEVAERTGLTRANVLVIRHRTRKNMREHAVSVLGFSPFGDEPAEARPS